MVSTPPHERAGGSLAFSILTAANTNGGRPSRADWIMTDRTTPILLGTSMKCPDESFRPRYLAARAFPTVVVETALTESDANLEADARRWVTGPNGAVTAITIRLQKETEQIVLRRWVLANGTPVIRQETTIANAPPKEEASRQML